MNHKAQEHEWVTRLLARLTPAEREEYERRMAAAKGHWRTGKKYDSLKAVVAEEVMHDFRNKKPEE